jgi:hypothetical protein
MAAMTFIFQFYDSLVKLVQFLLQFLDFVLNRETRGRISIDCLSGLCAHRQQVTGSRPPCGHRSSESQAVD